MYLNLRSGDKGQVVLLSDSAHALFVRATYLVCHRLISSWKGDLNVSLAALELLAGLARTPIRDTGKLSVSLSDSNVDASFRRKIPLVA